MRSMTNIECFNLYHGLNSVDHFVSFFTSFCMQTASGEWLTRIRPLVLQAENLRKWHGNSRRLMTAVKNKSSCSERIS